jgi:hypothetical protein
VIPGATMLDRLIATMTDDELRYIAPLSRWDPEP